MSERGGATSFIETDLSNLSDEELMLVALQDLENTERLDDLSERRDVTLAALQETYGSRVFTFKSYTGTIGDLAACPAFMYEVDQGYEAATAWLERYDGTPEDQPETVNESPDQEKEISKDDPTSDAAVVQDQNHSPENPVEDKSDTKKARNSVIDAVEQGESTSRAGDTVDSSGQDGSARAEIVRSNVGADQSVEKTEHTEPTDTNNPISAVAINILESFPTSDNEAHIISAERNDGPDDRFATKPMEARDIQIDETDVSTQRLIAVSIEESSVRESDKQPDQLIMEADYSEKEDTEQEPGALVMKQTDLDEFVNEPVITDEIMDNVSAKPEAPVPKREDDGTDRLENKADQLAKDDDGTQALNNELFLESSQYETAIEKPITDGEDDVQIDSSLTEVASAEPVNEIETLFEPEQVLTAETTKVLVDMVGDAPNDIPEILPTKTLAQIQSTRTAILNLESAKSAKECHEAVTILQYELAHLLELLGYDHANLVAERLVKQYDTATLKKYLIMLQQMIDRQSSESVLTRQFAAQRPQQHYGEHAVRSVVSI